MKFLISAAIALIILFTSTFQPKILLETENKTLAVVNARDNLPLTINFIHSVQKTPVIEELEYQNGQFILLRTKYKSQGVGLPFDASEGTFRRDKDWFIFDMNRRFNKLELRTGKGTQLKVTLGEKTYELYKKFPLGTKIVVKTI